MPGSDRIFVGNFREAAKRVLLTESDEAARLRALRMRPAALASEALRWRDARRAIPSLW